MRAFCSLFTLVLAAAATAQPYTGTIFVEPDIIDAADPTAYVSSTYTGQGMETVYDYRVSGWVTINVYHFTVLWDDGLSTVAMVNPEFASEAAANAEAVTYGTALGKVPACLREGVHALWIHAGVASFGGGNNAIVIHTGRGQEYIADGILEEAFVHEGTHCSLSSTFDQDAGWLAAQAADPDFISTYAQDYPLTEDLPETYLMWLAVRHRPSRLSVSDRNTILATIPNRLAFLDGVACDLYPLVSEVGIAPLSSPAVSVTVYPSPAHDHITAQVDGPVAAGTRFELFGGDGRLLRSIAIRGTTSVDLTGVASGLCYWKVGSEPGEMITGRLVVE